MKRAFQFDPEKALQAAAFLLRREPGHRMNCMRLLKILYLAERESLRESGKPITGSRVVAMKRGPVLEDVLGLIRGQHRATPRWAECIRADNYQLEMFNDPGVGKLSKFVTAKLEEVARRHQADDEWDMVEVAQQLPEWRRNDPGDSSREIPLADILEAVGRGGDFDKIVELAQLGVNAAAFFSEAEPLRQAHPV